MLYRNPRNHTAKANRGAAAGTRVALALALALACPCLAFAGEGPEAAGASLAPQSEGGVDMHRLYNPNSGEHFYTAEIPERDHLVSVGWNYEGVGWVAPSSGTDVYRLYNANAGDHHYTNDIGERDYLASIGWMYEGVGWASADESGIPLYRQYNPNAVAGSHNYTTSRSENDYLVSVGWYYEGVGWYGVGEGDVSSQNTAPNDNTESPLVTASTPPDYDRIPKDKIASIAKEDRNRLLFEPVYADLETNCWDAVWRIELADGSVVHEYVASKPVQRKGLNDPDGYIAPGIVYTYKPSKAMRDATGFLNDDDLNHVFPSGFGYAAQLTRSAHRNEYIVTAPSMGKFAPIKTGKDTLVTISQGYWDQNEQWNYTENQFVKMIDANGNPTSYYPGDSLTVYIDGSKQLRGSEPVLGKNERLPDDMQQYHFEIGYYYSVWRTVDIPSAYDNGFGWWL